MKKVLVVDDNLMMRRLIINMFHENGLEFHEASDGKEGLEKILEHAYDLVITDIVMPGMEGLEMIIQVKRRVPGLRIIAISGAKPYYLYMAKKLGIDAVFTKPLNCRQFKDKVLSILPSQPQIYNRAS